jgi:asparagine synthase (glutamine-hydrolysing)
MCGIGGKLNFDREEPADPVLLGRMMGRLVHRGPDGSGAYVRGPIALGHRRLSIIDLETGAQPMANEDGSIQLVFNGEIYNFAALRQELVASGHRFRSFSDTEVIVHLYEELGADCVKRLQGMFAFALWDERRHRLLLARDRVGIKPLYYVVSERAIAFASEMKALLADPSVERRVDATAIDRFLTYRYVAGCETPIAGIRKLEPGHCLIVEADRVVRDVVYWDLVFDEPMRTPGLDESAARLKALLERTVADHMISDVPVGVLLSGGVDSSAILHFATQASNRPLHTFTVGFGEAGVIDERPYARLAAQANESEHHETTLTANDFRDQLPAYVWHMEEPVCEPPAIALHAVARLARDTGVKVLLSGEGGDEAFAGYPEYRNLLALETLKSWFGPARPLVGLGFEALRFAGWRRAAHYRALVQPALGDYYLSRTSSPDAPFNRLKPSLYRDGFLAAIEHPRADAPTRRCFARASDAGILNRMLYVDTKTWLPDDLLVKADKMTMAASVELRVPFLDHHVLEFAAALPRTHKVSGGQLKRVLRRALRDLVPREILNRKKAGFPVPYDRWLQHDLRDYVADTILARGSLSESWFSRAAVDRLLADNRNNGRYAKEVFCLLVLELWHRQFIAAPAERSSSATVGVSTARTVRPHAEEKVGA